MTVVNPSTEADLKQLSSMFQIRVTVAESGLAVGDGRDATHADLARSLNLEPWQTRVDLLLLRHGDWLVIKDFGVTGPPLPTSVKRRQEVFVEQLARVLEVGVV